MKKKKGFTLVELLVVIAILAVLATVSVVGYMGFTKKAHESNDIGLTTQMNTILQAEEVTNKPTSPHEAVQQLANGGVDVEKLTPTTDGYNYVYDLDTNRMFLLDDQKVVVAPTNITFTKDLNVFAFVGSENDIKNLDGYSYYLKSNFTFTGTKLEIKAGLDVGNNNISEISYTNTGANVLIRTNGGNLTVNDATGSVNHHGLLEKAVIENINSASYHEYGYVTDYIEAKNGHIVIEKGASVSILAVNGDPTVDQKEGSELYKVVPVGENTTVNTNKVKVLNNETVAKNSITTEELSNMKYGGGNGTETKPYELYTASHLVAFAKDVNKGNFKDFVYAKLCADVNISNMGWEPIGNSENPFIGSFDGSNKTITGLTNKGYSPSTLLWGITSNAKNRGLAYGFFGVIGFKDDSTDKVISIKDLVFKDVNIDINDTNMLGVLVGADTGAAKIGEDYVNPKANYDITISNIKTFGKMICKSDTTVGGIVGKLYTNDCNNRSKDYGIVTIENCENNVSITIENEGTNKIGGIVGYVHTRKINLISCKNNADIIINKGNAYVGGLLSYFDSQNIYIEKCSVSGVINFANENNINSYSLLIGNFKPYTAQTVNSKVIINNKETNINQNQCGNKQSVFNANKTTLASKVIH